MFFLLEQLHLFQNKIPIKIVELAGFLGVQKWINRDECWLRLWTGIW